MASLAASCESNTLAFPAKTKIDSSTPAVFTIQPFSARFPNKTARPPSLK